MLTEMENKVYAFILSYKKENGVEPTEKEIQKELSLTQPYASHLLSALKKKGVIRPCERRANYVINRR